MSEPDIEKKAPLEILISTMDRTSLSFLDKMFQYHILGNLHVLIINQTSKGKELTSNKNNIRVINSYDKGLSKSRNLAINNAVGDICLIADDDIEYVSGFENSILKSFSIYNDASVILFKIETFCGKAYKKYFEKSKQLKTNKHIESTSSVEIAFKRKDIIANNIMFNPLFGLGSCFTSGEEYLFLKDVLAQKMNVYFGNITIVKHSFERSTSNMASSGFIKAKAAEYYIDYNSLSYVFLLKFIFFLYRKKLMPLKDFVTSYSVGISSIKLLKKLMKEDD